jgi:D-beta-D-heptose 7-phosphate kinase / D-beta-D-heptose 1-phosphate adenosyltransferase
MLIVGDVMLDQYIWGDVHRISPEAPVPIVRVERRSQSPGGAGNVALNLKNLGCEVMLFGIRGNDAEGSGLSRLLEEKKITSHLFAVPGFPTTTKTRIMGKGQQLLRLDDENIRTISDETASQLLAAIRPLLNTFNAVILSDYGKGVLNGTLAQEIIQAATSIGVSVFIDPKGLQWTRYKSATCLTPNWSEFLSCMGLEKIDESELPTHAGKLVQDLGLEYLLITRGSAGMVLFGKEGLIRQLPAQAREVYDVSGAGDTVVSVLAAARAAGFNMSDAADLANTAAGVVVGKVGTQPIDKGELESALKRRSMVRVEKLFTLSELEHKISAWRSNGQRIVFTNGCFDILHMGHVHLLQSAARMGDRLIIGLNSDASIRRIKGKDRPILPEAYRAGLLAALECVDAVVLFQEDTPLETILRLRPDVLVKGADYEGRFIAGQKEVEAWGGWVALIPFSHDLSTTKIIEDLRSR